MANEMNDYDEVVKKIARVILTHQQKMIREEDLLNFCGDSINFDDVIVDVYSYLKNVGFDLVKTNFQEQKFYVLITEGKDDKITPSQYGTLALILALTKEIDENIKIEDLKEIFSEVWTSDIQTLIERDYLREIEELGIIKVTPLAKAMFYSVYKDLKLQNLIDIFKNK